MPAPDRLSPFTASRRLRSGLRRSRLNLHLTQQTVAHHMGWSPSRVAKVEGGDLTITRADLLALCDLYDVGRAGREQLERYHDTATERSWWRELHVTPAVGALIDIESEATRMRTFATTQVPILLQTRDYATGRDRTILSRRQRVLTGEDAPAVEVILDEAVLYRCVQGPACMAGQLLWLAELGRRPNVDLRVLSFETGELTPTGDFTVFDLPDDEPFVHLESIGGRTTSDAEDLVATHLATFVGMSLIALDPTRTNHLLHHTAEQYKSGNHARPWL